MIRDGEITELRAEIARLREDYDRVWNEAQQAGVEITRLRAALAVAQIGTVSVELLQIERDTCDRIRAENDALRATLAAAQAGAQGHGACVKCGAIWYTPGINLPCPVCTLPEE